MAIIASAPIQYASSAVVAGTAQQIVKINSTGTTAGFATGTSGYFLLNIPAGGLVANKPFQVCAQGYYNVVTTTTAAIGISWAKYVDPGVTAAGPTMADAFTAVASASLTGAAAPGTAYAWQIQMDMYLSTQSSTTDSLGILSAKLPNSYFVGAAAVTPVTIGTQLTTVSYGLFSQPEPGTGINTTGPASKYSLQFGVNFLNASSNTTADSTFVLTALYAKQD